MKPEQLVASRELCQSLVDNGIVLDTYFNWVGDELWDKTMESDYTTRTTTARLKWIPAPTAEDLMVFLEKLPTTNNITINPIVGNICAVSLYTPHKNIRIEGHTLSNGLAKLAIKVKKYE